MTHSGPGATPLRDPERPSPAADLSDASRAATGDVRAFERLYRSHVARIHGLARRMIGADLADEVTQDVFVRAWQKLGTFRGESAFGTWLHRLAINVMLSRRAWLGTQRARFAGTDAALETEPSRPVGTDARLDMDAAIERLPHGARQIFVLHDVEGYRHEEIATFLGVTSGTTKAQLHRARMLLRRHLAPAETA
jgi:RNA polymerase sigma-70 factor, ECF subfamily